MIERHSLESGPIEEPSHPILHGQIELDETLVYQYRDLPDADGAEKDPPTVPPGLIDRLSGYFTQPLIAAIQPKGCLLYTSVYGCLMKCWPQWKSREAILILGRSRTIQATAGP